MSSAEAKNAKNTNLAASASGATSESKSSEPAKPLKKVQEFTPTFCITEGKGTQNRSCCSSFTILCLLFIPGTTIVVATRTENYDDYKACSRQPTCV
jgi:hypothetical protein